jgi:hypothetical protein
MEKNKRLTDLATSRTKPSSSLEQELLELKKAVARLEAQWGSSTITDLESRISVLESRANEIGEAIARLELHTPGAVAGEGVGDYND